MTKLPSIKRPEFTAYLKAFEPSKIVGITNDGGKCPIARYLTDHFGLKGVEVIFGEYNYSGEDDKHHNQKTAIWVNNFIVDVDDEVPEYRPVTAKRALQVLAAVRK